MGVPACLFDSAIDASMHFVEMQDKQRKLKMLHLVARKLLKQNYCIDIETSYWHESSSGSLAILNSSSIYTASIAILVGEEEGGSGIIASPSMRFMQDHPTFSFQSYSFFEKWSSIDENIDRLCKLVCNGWQIVVVKSRDTSIRHLSAFTTTSIEDTCSKLGTSVEALLVEDDLACG